jgi:hypothetical protein
MIGKPLVNNASRLIHLTPPSSFYIDSIKYPLLSHPGSGQTTKSILGFMATRLP